MIQVHLPKALQDAEQVHLVLNPYTKYKTTPTNGVVLYKYGILTL